MLDEPTDRPCEVCDRQKDPTEIQIRRTATSNDKTPFDRVRGFIQGSGDSSESSGSSGNEVIAKTFYLCSHLPCEGREDDIRKMKRWELKNDPAQEFSEEKLDEIVKNMVEQDQNDHQIITDVADDVRSRLVDDSSEASTENDTHTDDR